MPRRTSLEKAGRLLAHGRLTLRLLSDTAIVAEVLGDSALIRRTGWDSGSGRWWCSCQAGQISRQHDSSARCSHAMALKLVVLQPLPSRGTGPDGRIEVGA
jgi:hypothetical protein